ncbi:MAG TPA: hypothetical protein VLU43_04470 [Anaeromyxobacteraceae bacterium]|nr:hypothetical protein [Anaeromyxobacteraceae bacterium]
MRITPICAALLTACAAAPTVPAPAPEDLAPAAGAGERCARGFAGECRDLGRAHLLGEGVKQDDRLAAAYLMEACEIGDPSGCGALAVLHALGRALPQSDEKAGALSRRACERGSALGCSNFGVLLAEGAVKPPPTDDDEGGGARVLKLFRTACDAGVAEGCVNLGAAFDGGGLTGRDLGQAARAYQRGCEAGSPLGCWRLAALATERPEAAPGANVPALEGRACRAGIGSACAALKQPAPPPSYRTPVSRLVADRTSLVLGFPGAGGFHATDLAEGRGVARTPPVIGRRPSAAVQAAVPEPLRLRLGVAGDPTTAGDDPPVEMLVALRRHLLGQCYEGPRSAPSSAVELYTVFMVDADGRVGDVRAAAEPADAALEQCAGELVGDWDFPQPDGGSGGPYLVRHAFEALPAGPAPEFAGPGTLRPASRDTLCIERRLKVPPEYRGAVGSVTVKLVVDPQGRPGLMHVLTPAPDAIVRAISDAIARCEWSAGADARGAPATLWLTLTVNLSR